VDPKSNMAALTYDWLTHFRLFPPRTTSRIYSKHVTNISDEVLTKCCQLLSGSEIHYGRPDV